MNVNDLPRRWLFNLNLKVFALNSRPNHLPNLWCLCKISLNPSILALDDQQVSFTITDQDKTFAISAVYASTSYLARRKLWCALNLLQSQHQLPWCFLGDFNVILGAHEYRGSFSPARLPIEDFQQWTDTFNLIHLPTRGAEFTWHNGRGGNGYTEKRLDRAICNQFWLDSCCSSSVTALTRVSSDHFPLLLDLQVTSNSFASQFKFQRMWSLHDDCSRIVSDCWKSVVVGGPMYILTQKLKILKDRLRVWNKSCFGNVHANVTAAEDKLHQIQLQIQQNGHTDALLFEEKLAAKLYEDALNKQEVFWQERARLNWHLEGDRNTKYFHRIAKIKSSTKSITSLHDGEQVITDSHEIAEHVINYYKNLFCSNTVLQESLLAEEVIPNHVTPEINSIMTMLPSSDEIKAAVFALNKDSAPGPDGFGAFFFQHYWEIVKVDVINAVMEFFSTSWILPGFNSNIIALIPKSPDASSITQYRPIAMANFKFKIITKIIADRLASILPNLVSEEQKGFIKDRDIKDCLCIASEAANLIHNKAHGGNLALKIDITKAFDTLDWSFLLKVLKTFGFNDTFCNWIHATLQSAFLSISINGKSHGYFNCSRGVRQGDPLSPLLFCLAEDVLSRSITKLVTEGKLSLIKGTRNFDVPSHCFYADDLMIYCKGNIAGLKALTELFAAYALESGQVISTSKSTIYSGSISPRRLDLIVQVLHFNVGSLPFSYLGVPIFKGKPKAYHFQPIVDRVKLKLASWKASLLSIAGRIQLVRSVIQSMLTYTISLYSWPVSLLKYLEKCIRNFIWSGEIDKRKLVTTSWKKVCRPLSQGGLNLRSLVSLNKASNLKLCWTFINSQSSWAKLLRDRVLRHKKPINYHIFSSIWSSIKEEYDVIIDNSIWLIGNGEDINFWNDNWCGLVLSDYYNIPSHTRKLLLSTVKDYISNGSWNIPYQLDLEFPGLSNLVNQTIIPLEQNNDSLIWKHTDSGSLEMKEAYNFKMPPLQDLYWTKFVWSPDIPPSKSLMAWRLMHDKMPTDENLILRGCIITSMCNLCHKHVETTFHMFFQCEFAVKLWSWLAGCLNLTIQFTTMEDMWRLCEMNWSPQSKVTLIAAIINLLNTLWFVRNQARFHDKLISWRSAISLVIANTSLTGNHTKKLSSNSIRDFTFLKQFRISIHHPRAPVLKEVLWQPPLLNWYKCNVDGASQGNPGNASCGGIFRDSAADFVQAFAEPLGIVTSYFAELNGAMRAIEIAFHHGWHNLWLETDSSLVVAAFSNPNNLVSWRLRSRWTNVLTMLRQMNFMVTHIFREGNQAADLLANHGLNLTSIIYWHHTPSFLCPYINNNKLGIPSFRYCLS
ncbi:hypothetical protein QL285_028147 [Trifolium repens]|nr:hypothetical protein QL285_028147 [Trifolium repens]